MRASELAVIAERADAATPGPWHQGRDGIRHEDTREVYSTRDPFDAGARDIAGFDLEADAAFATAARTDVPALLAEVLRLQEGIQQAITLHSVESRKAYVIADHLQGLISEVRA